MKQADAVIIGGGVIGLTAAYFLAREGTRVAVLDKGDFGQESSWAGAGILPPASFRVARTPYEQLRAKSAELFPALSQELRELTGIDNGYLRGGGLEFLETRGTTRPDEWRVEGTGTEALDEAAVTRLEPGLRNGLGKAVFLADMAQVRNPRHLKALLAGCAARGVQMYPGTPAEEWVRDGKRIVAVRTGTGAIAADRFLLAAGAWSDPLLASLGIRPGIRPIRGQIALLSTSTPIFRRILLWGDQYLVPRPDGRVLVGSTEEDVGFDKRTTAGAIRQLLDLAEWLVPNLNHATLERCWAGLRPGSPDGLPFLGGVPGVDNVFVAAGHFRSGIQLSPATALVIKEVMLGQPPSVSLADFRLDRGSACNA